MTFTLPIPHIRAALDAEAKQPAQSLAIAESVRKYLVNSINHGINQVFTSQQGLTITVRLTSVDNRSSATSWIRKTFRDVRDDVNCIVVKFCFLGVNSTGHAPVTNRSFGNEDHQNAFRAGLTGLPCSRAATHWFLAQALRLVHGQGVLEFRRLRCNPNVSTRPRVLDEAGDLKDACGAIYWCNVRKHIDHAFYQQGKLGQIFSSLEAQTPKLIGVKFHENPRDAPI